MKKLYCPHCQKPLPAFTAWYLVGAPNHKCLCCGECYSYDRNRAAIIAVLLFLIAIVVAVLLKNVLVKEYFIGIGMVLGVVLLAIFAKVQCYEGHQRWQQKKLKWVFKLLPVIVLILVLAFGLYNAIY